MLFWYQNHPFATEILELGSQACDHDNLYPRLPGNPNKLGICLSKPVYTPISEWAGSSYLYWSPSLSFL